MRSVIAIRTHRWAEEERLLARFAGRFPGDIVVVFHNRTRGLRPPIPVVDINNAWVVVNQMRSLPDRAWRCGARLMQVVGERLAANTGFLRNMRQSLAYLAETDVERIVEPCAASVRKSLMDCRDSVLVVQRVRRK